MADNAQTVTVNCAYCTWHQQEQAPNERAAVTLGKRLRAELLDHCHREHAIEVAGPLSDGAPQPPMHQLEPVEELREQLDVCQEALRRIGTQNTLTAAKKIAMLALQGIAPHRAWNRTTP